jgi:hypothetical protein
MQWILHTQVSGDSDWICHDPTSASLPKVCMHAIFCGAAQRICVRKSWPKIRVLGILMSYSTIQQCACAAAPLLHRPHMHMKTFIQLSHTCAPTTYVLNSHVYSHSTPLSKKKKYLPPYFCKYCLEKEESSSNQDMCLK